MAKNKSTLGYKAVKGKGDIRLGNKEESTSTNDVYNLLNILAHLKPATDF